MFDGQGHRSKLKVTWEIHMKKTFSAMHARHKERQSNDRLKSTPEMETVNK